MYMTSLISVSNKKGLDTISNFLIKKGYNILSTGGTYSSIKNDINIKYQSRLKTVSEVTSFPEILDGRVKTLHPIISGAILAKKDNYKHIEELQKYNIPDIKIVIVNLYPFKEVINNPNNTLDDAIENIDIGGHTLIREASKNYNDILIIVDPNDYQLVIDNFDAIDLKFRRKMAEKALVHATDYDIAISNYFNTDKRDIFRHYTKELDFKYGCNPHQNISSLYNIDRNNSPFKLINGVLGYINIIDAIHSWQLVHELSTSLELCAAASFKHTSPAGVGTSVILNKTLKESYNVEDIDLTPLATAFIRARYTDPMSSFGDFIALSHKVDLVTAKLIKREVSDGVIAPDFDPEALEILKQKKNGKFIIIQVDSNYSNTNITEIKELFGVAITQQPNNYKTNINSILNIVTDNTLLTSNCIRDMIIANISLKYAQSNNVSYAYDGQLLGIASGQQNRVDCVRLAGEKATLWCLMQHPKVLELRKLFKPEVKRQDKINGCIRFIQGNFTKVEYQYWLKLFLENASIPDKISEDEKDIFIKLNFNSISMASDAFFPFRDSIDFASQYGVKYIIQPGGSVADTGVITACNEYNMVMSFSNKRLFYH